MHRVPLKFATATVDVSVSDPYDVLAPRYEKPLDDVETAVLEALANPIGSPSLSCLARGKQSVCIVVSDRTRPIPYPCILPSILKVLAQAGLQEDQIVFLIATGIHQPMTPKEIALLLGEDTARKYRVENHLGRSDQGIRSLGRTESGVPLEVNERYLDSDLKILTGLIEPHLLAGYSGGSKAILPGLCGSRTMRYMHGHTMIGHPLARNGIVQGNPFRLACEEVRRIVGADFLLNVTAGQERQLTGVFAGNPLDAWSVGVQFVQKQVECVLPDRYDLVVTSAGGVPPDRTLYQSVKSFEVAADIVKPGGAILVIAECSEGAGSKAFDDILGDVGSPQEALGLIESEGFFRLDQWIVQHLCQAASHARLFGYIPGIKPDKLKRWFIEPVACLQDDVRTLLENGAVGATASAAKVALLPGGPRIVPRYSQVKASL